jgi:YebC/PmpR family DNA-binding regulatory protein
MAGHSKFANIKHRKNAQDAKRAKVFTKLTREITVAAASGQPDPEFNPRLRNAMATARKAGVPKDRIETAVKKGSGELEGENYEEMRYEGYGPGGVALIIDALTDNKNRSASDIRACFSKNGGNLAETGSVSFMFDRVGLIEYEQSVAGDDEMFEVAAEAGADDVESGNGFHIVTCDPDQFSQVRDALVAKYGDPESAQLGWNAKDPVDIDKEQAEKVLKLVDALEDNDDVQTVSGNYTVSDDVLESLVS